jgi:hypothetical protein
MLTCGWKRTICYFNDKSIKFTKKYKLRLIVDKDENQLCLIGIEWHFPPIGIIRYGYYKED